MFSTGIYSAYASGEQDAALVRDRAGPGTSASTHVDAQLTMADRTPARSTGPCRAAPVIAAVLVLSGCSQVDPASEDDADAVDVRDSCTGQGQHVLDSPHEQQIDNAPETDQGTLTVTLGQISSNGPTASLELSSTGADESQAEFEGEVG